MYSQPHTQNKQLAADYLYGPDAVESAQIGLGDDIDYFLRHAFKDDMVPLGTVQKDIVFVDLNCGAISTEEEGGGGSGGNGNGNGGGGNGNGGGGGEEELQPLFMRVWTFNPGLAQSYQALTVSLSLIELIDANNHNVLTGRHWGVSPSSSTNVAPFFSGPSQTDGLIGLSIHYSDRYIAKESHPEVPIKIRLTRPSESHIPFHTLKLGYYDVPMSEIANWTPYNNTRPYNFVQFWELANVFSGVNSVTYTIDNPPAAIPLG